jgi:hypothetical protein
MNGTAILMDWEIPFHAAMLVIAITTSNITQCLCFLFVLVLLYSLLLVDTVGMQIYPDVVYPLQFAARQPWCSSCRCGRKCTVFPFQVSYRLDISQEQKIKVFMT